MDMVARKAIDDYCNLIRQELIDNTLIKELFNLLEHNHLHACINFYENTSFKTTYVYVSISVYDNTGKLYEVPRESIFYDDLGSLGGCDCIASYKKNFTSFKKMSITNELYDDVNLSIKYLKSL